MIEQIRKERIGIELTPKNDIILALKNKLDLIYDQVPDLVYRLSEKCLNDIKSITVDDDLVNIIVQWIDIINLQEPGHIKDFMNGLGSILMRVKCD